MKEKAQIISMKLGRKMNEIWSIDFFYNCATRFFSFLSLTYIHMHTHTHTLTFTLSITYTFSLNVKQNEIGISVQMYITWLK